MTRRGRASSAVTSEDVSYENESGDMPALRVESDANEDTAILKTLIESVLGGSSSGLDDLGQASEEIIIEEELPLPNAPMPNSPIFKIRKRNNENSLVQDEYNRKYGYERPPLPRNVDSVFHNFGNQMADSLRRNPAKAGGHRLKPLPQLVQFTNGLPPQMNLFARQSDGTEEGTEGEEATDDNSQPENGFFTVPDSSDDEVRCIPKVMQVRM